MVKLEHVVKIFNQNEKKKDHNEKAAVSDISLDIREGEFLTILGPSGCGKTTTLRMIAGFEKCSEGKIYLENEDVTSMAPYERKVNTIFQNYALFPHMNIYDNIAFGLSIKKVPKKEIEKKVLEMIKVVQLEGMEKRMPNQLSGGQKQRVAIARAIINNPKVLLLDEPLSALDKKLRKNMQVELKHLQQQLGITFVFVTHDQEEALIMSDRICIMNNGEIEQLGTPSEIYEYPKTRFVADFIGETNIFEGTVKDIMGSKVCALIEDENEISFVSENVRMNEAFSIAIRPERIKIKNSPEESESYLKVKYKERIYSGSYIKTIVTLNNKKEIMVSEPAGDVFDMNKHEGDLYITWNPENAVVISA